MKKTLLSLIFILSSFLHAQTIHFVPADFNSIQEAIDASEDFDQIIVSPGTYFENINFNGKSLEISSNYIFDNDPNTISSTIINGGSNGRVVQINNSFFAGLNGFTITNGSHPGGAGIYSTLSTLELTNLIITQNTASDDGGGIHCHDCYMLLMNTTISLNSASVFGGGVFIENDSQVSIVDCNINNNTSNSSGGGVYVTATNNYNKDVHITCSEISNNTGTGISTSNSMLVLADVVITENTQIGLAMGDATDIQANNTYIVNNNEELINGQAFDLYSDGSTGLGFSNSVVGLITNSGSVPGEGNSSNCFGCTETSENAATQALISCVVTGCTNTTACNYNSSATEDDGSCVLLNETCDTCSEDGLSVLDNDLDNDGVCDIDEVAGCTDSTACNYNVLATNDDGSCEEIPQVTISGETETCEESVLLEAIGGPYDSYQWYLDGNIINNENQNTLLVTQTGTYKIEAENSGFENNYSLLFNGQGDYVEINDSDALSTGLSDFTISTSIKINNIPTTPSPHVAIIQQFENNDNKWQIYVLDNQLYFGIKDGGSWNEVSVPWVPQINNWHHISCVRESGEISFYVDGENIGSVVAEINIPNLTAPLTLGKYEWDTDFTGLDGNLDNISLWNQALSFEQINSFINCPPTGNELGLLAYWALEEVGSALIFDIANNTYNGSFVNMNTNEAWDPETPQFECLTCLSSEETNITINNCGCTDSSADNFDSTANEDDGSCEYLGCTDSSADNFDATANVDDGTCEYLGCTDSGADNFDITANVDDGTCEYLGCTDSSADNFDSTANVDDGTCEYQGCTDSNADNFDPTANLDDGGCEYLGCTDSNADNFDFTANVDNGSCEYLGCTDLGACNYNNIANVDDGTCEYDTCAGCTDPSADNYNPEAIVDNGSCSYFGCIDTTADNFDSTANIDDGSCEYLGCTDSLADNFDSTANVDDGTCEYLGCTDPSACNFDVTANTNDGSCQLCASREFNDGAYLDVDSEIINAQGITISFWVNDTDFCENPEDFATYIDFGSQDSYRYVVRNRSCKIEAFFEGDMLPTEFDWGTMDWGYPKASAAGSLVPNGEQTGWRQVTTVFCPTTIRIYVDGEIVASNGTGVYFQEGFNLFTDDVKRIGSNQVDYEPANAMIDEVRIWNRALSGEEVLARAGGATTLNIDEELNLNGYWQMDCANPLLNQVTGQLGSDNLSLVNENFNGNNCETNSEYGYECSLDFEGNPDCNSCDPPEGCTDEEACNYDYLAVISIPNACFYIIDYCPDLEYPEYYDCDCKCINDSDSDDVCDELEVEGCSEDEGACNYNPEGTEPCTYPEDEFGVTYVDCEGVCLNDIDGDGVCDEEDNCVDVYNPNQEDLNDDGIGDDCDGVGLEEGVVAKELIKVTDVLGRETQKQTKGSTLMYWYNTGEVEINYIF